MSRQAEICPLPPLTSFLPSLVSMWNSIKVGVDITSKGINACVAPHAGARTEGVLWLIMILHCARATWKMVQCCARVRV